jgi:hypothetical protein
VSDERLNSVVAGLQALHGERWADHFAPVFKAALQARDPWAVDAMAMLLEQARDTVRLAEQVGGDPEVALQHARGMDEESACRFMDLPLEARGR